MRVQSLRRTSAGIGRSGLGALHGLLSRLLHTPGRVCVYGWPDHEENSLFAALLLADVEGLQVTLLAARPAAARAYLATIRPEPPPVEVVAKNSLGGLLRASAAEVLLFTHGLYGSPDLTDRKLVINLWHGFGPKANDNAAFAARIPFTVLTCNTPVWGRAAAHWLGADGARVRRTGNPRQVAFGLPPEASALARLGLQKDGFVLWMPTYRATNGAAGPAWRDSPDLPTRTDLSGADPVSELAALAKAEGVEVIVKPHPLDTARYDRSGVRVIATDEIFASGMSLYQLIAASRAMISDYSSVWVEYLSLDKPLILYCPDLFDYDVGRGFSEPTMMELAPGLIAPAASDLRPFLQAVAAGGDWGAEHRRSARAKLEIQPGPVDGQAFTSAVLEEVERHRSRRPGRGNVPFDVSNDQSETRRLI